jgi:hypothetical protein
VVFGDVTIDQPGPEFEGKDAFAAGGKCRIGRALRGTDSAFFPIPGDVPANASMPRQIAPATQTNAIQNRRLAKLILSVNRSTARIRFSPGRRLYHRPLNQAIATDCFHSQIPTDFLLRLRRRRAEK